MIAQLTVLLVCQLIGEVSVRFLTIPLPGPVLGMVILLALLSARGRIGEPMQTTAGGLLDHLSLLFVPAGVGVMIHLPLIGAEWPAIATALVVSTVVTMVATAWMMVLLARPATKSPPEERP